MWEVHFTISAYKHSDIGTQHFVFFISLQQPIENSGEGDPEYQEHLLQACQAD